MIRVTLTDEQRDELRPAARQMIGRVSERIHFVLLADQGHTPAEIATLLGYDVATVRTWLVAYQQRGLAGLDDAPRSGRPPVEKHLVAIAQAQTSQPPPQLRLSAGLLDDRVLGATPLAAVPRQGQHEHAAPGRAYRRLRLDAAQADVAA
jgi:hypothetical protein